MALSPKKYASSIAKGFFLKRSITRGINSFKRNSLNLENLKKIFRPKEAELVKVSKLDKSSKIYNHASISCYLYLIISLIIILFTLFFLTEKSYLLALTHLSIFFLTFAKFFESSITCLQIKTQKQITISHWILSPKEWLP